MQCWWKDTHTSVEITDWENIFANPKSETGFITRIYKELKIQLKNPFIKWTKDRNKGQTFQ